jgi:hypothetical protein
LVAFGIARRFGMLAAVNFNDEAAFVTDEVSDKRTDRRLTSKADAFQAMTAECSPKMPLGVGHIFA